jgi:hypothetical protein
MGVRFSRRIKIAKGVHLNLSKSGIGMSIGGRGLSVSSGRRGTYLNTGIPGTGISNRTKIGGSSTSNKSSSMTQLSGYGIKFDEERNKVVILAPDGGFLSDDSIEAKRIKRTDAYKDALREFNKKAIEMVEEETASVTEIYKSTPRIVTKEYLQEQLKRQPLDYTKKSFSEPYPTAESCAAYLIANLPPLYPLLIKLYIISKDRYLKRMVPRKLVEEVARWEKAKAEFEKNEDEQFAATVKANEEMVEENREIVERLKGEKRFIIDTIARIYGEITLPVEFSINTDYDTEKHIVYLDIDLPEIETMPHKKASELSGGKLSVKEKTTKELKYDYARCVAGMAFYLVGLAFNVSTEIENIVASGYTQRVSKKTGNEEDDYVYSVIFDRKKFSETSFAKIDPIEAIQSYDSKINMTATFEMKTIEPFAAI